MPKSNIQLLDRKFVPVTIIEEITDYYHYLEPGTSRKALQRIRRKMEIRSSELGLKLTFRPDLINCAITLSESDHMLWDASKSTIKRSVIQIIERGFTHDPVKALYFHKPEEGMNVSALCTHFRSKARTINKEVEINFEYDPNLAIITLVPEHYQRWIDIIAEYKRNKNATPKKTSNPSSKKRKATGAPRIPVSEREFTLTENGAWYEHKVRGHEKPKDVAHTLNKNALGLKLNTKIVKFHYDTPKMKVSISFEGYNLWQPAMTQSNAPGKQSNNHYKNIRLSKREFCKKHSKTGGNDYYAHTPEKGIFVDRLLENFHLKAKGLRLDVTIAKFYLDADNNICISPEGYQLWVESFPRQNRRPTSAKDRVFVISADNTFYEHFADSDLYMVTRDLNSVAKKLCLSKSVNFTPNIENGSVMISIQGYDEWSRAMENYSRYKFPLQNNTNNANSSEDTIFNINDLAELEQAASFYDINDATYELHDVNAETQEKTPEYNIYDSIFALSENEDEEYDLQNIVDASNAIDAFPFETPAPSITPWSQNYCGPSGLFQHSQSLHHQTNSHFDLDNTEKNIPRNN